MHPLLTFINLCINVIYLIFPSIPSICHITQHSTAIMTINTAVAAPNSGPSMILIFSDFHLNNNIIEYNLNEIGPKQKVVKQIIIAATQEKFTIDYFHMEIF